MQGRRRVEIKSQKRLLDDFFKIDEYIVSHEQYDGEMSADQRRLNFERGDAVAVLLLNVDTRSVVLVRQFKLPTLVGRRRDDPAIQDGWVTETMAGMIGADETAEDAAIRETYEETGYEIESPEFICKFLSSPGGTSERIFLYFAGVSNSRRSGWKGTSDDDATGGLGDEDIKVFEVSVNDLFDQLTKGEIDDPKLAIAAYWLKDNMPRFEKLAPDTRSFAIRGRPGLIVGYKTGDLKTVKGVSAWVNPENSDMIMDRFIGRSISARIRSLGANRDGDSILEDTIQDSLRGMIGERAHVKIGTVLPTESGMLRGSHQVKTIFHVALVQGSLGEGVRAELKDLRSCAENVLDRVEGENRKFWRKFWNNRVDGILFPMMGAGEGGLRVDDVAGEIIPPAVDFLRSTPNPTLKEIYFLAFGLREKNACDKIFAKYCRDGILEPLGEGK
ncbi:MAG: NUDIX domain-containing protein [Xanthobacteraceae bacterium]